MKYFLIAGERSGDLHASNLVRQLYNQDLQAEVVAWGGNLTRDAGAQLLQHYNEISFMGIWEVLKNLATLKKKMDLCKSQISAFRPDVLILVDFPGFNLRMAEFARSLGIRTCYYISPKIWAWKKNRIKKIRAFVDKMLVILPFETAFYRELGYEVTYVGNPLMDAILDHRFDEHFQLPGGKQTIAVLPGSRQQEVARAIDVILDLAKNRQYHFCVAGVDNLDPEIYAPLGSLDNVSLHFNKTYELLRACDAAIVTSGTATLEAALLNAPQIVVYRTSALTYYIGRLLVNIRFISLVNLIAGREVVRELIQHDYNAGTIEKELHQILNDPAKKEKIHKGYSEIGGLIGKNKASEKAASEIVNWIS